MQLLIDKYVLGAHFMFVAKYDIKANKFLKPKGRWVVEGTPRNCRKYEHFWESYSLDTKTRADRARTR